jgi:predicted pyridoxine 5'-phosphate oxidase superfamily flavin-nucleotide-binding protein
LSYTSDIAFSDSVKAIQTRKGSRHAYHQMEKNGGWDSEITTELASYIAAQRSFLMATATADGQPYIQHRGGPAGFLKVVDARTLAFADYKGNQQFISQGNLQENPRAFLFLIDYASRTRVKIWGRAAVIEDQPALLAKLMPDPKSYKARPEQVIQFSVEAWDRNCPQHIPIRYDQEHVEVVIQQRENRITELENQIRSLLSEK